MPFLVPLASNSSHTWPVARWEPRFCNLWICDWRIFVRRKCFLYRAWGALGVRERESAIQRERERETDGSDVTSLALKMAMSFALFLAKIVHLSFAEEFCPFRCQKCAPLSAEFTLSSHSSFCFCQMAWQGIEAPKQTIEFPAAPSFFSSKKMNQINTEKYWKQKKRLCVRLRSGDKHQLRKSADRRAQISPVSGTNAFLICAFRSAVFLRWCLSPERNLTHNLFFCFQ